MKIHFYELIELRVPDTFELPYFNCRRTLIER